MVPEVADECPLLAISGSLSHTARTSAYPPTTDIQNGDVRFAPDFVCFTPRSGRYLGLRKTSGFDVVDGSRHRHRNVLKLVDATTRKGSNVIGRVNVR